MAAAAMESAVRSSGARSRLVRQRRPAPEPQAEEKTGRRMLLVPQASVKPGCKGTTGPAPEEIFIAAAAQWGAMPMGGASGSFERQGVKDGGE